MQDLSGHIVEHDATCAGEVAGLWQLIEMVKAREVQFKHQKDVNLLKILLILLGTLY
jgi:hypothetical protein